MSTILLLAAALFNTLGIIFIFIFGINPLFAKKGAAMLYKNESEMLTDQKNRHKEIKYFIYARVGLIFCIIGQLLQAFVLFM